MPPQRFKLQIEFIMLKFNKMCFLQVLLIDLVALTWSGYLSFFTHYIGTNKGRHSMHASLQTDMAKLYTGTDSHHANPF